jgi:hypothetical protein
MVPWFARLPRKVRAALALLLNTLVALLGVGLLTEAGRMIPVHTIAGAVTRAWWMNIACGAIAGYVIARQWRTHTAAWAWVTAGIVFVWMFLLQANLSASVLAPGLPFAKTWAMFSGEGCSHGERGCILFRVFTLPFVRSAAYSAGAALFALFTPNAAPFTFAPIVQHANAPDDPAKS